MQTVFTQAQIQEKSRETQEWILSTKSKIANRLNTICPPRSLDWSFDLPDRSFYRKFVVSIRDLRSALIHEGRTVYAEYWLGEYSTENLDESIEKMTQDLATLADEIDKSKYLTEDER